MAGAPTWSTVIVVLWAGGVGVLPGPFSPLKDRPTCHTHRLRLAVASSLLPGIGEVSTVSG